MAVRFGFMPTRAEFKAFSLLRLKEAQVLFDNGFYDGAFYLAGYALEFALKARICKLLDAPYPDTKERHEYGSFLTHSYRTLIRLAGLQKKLDSERYRSPSFSASWSLLAGEEPKNSQKPGWSESLRYKPIKKTSEEVADSKEAAANILDALSNEEYGLITWLKKSW